ncbi:MAG: LysR family transcriptional regulator [Alphaproteobacteria bacterium]|nr:LysR family transcriptional regulator [Alphaproteobacteria bacterium]
MPRMHNLDIDLLRAFVSVAEFGSFTLAADALLRRQSTISLQIKRLEDGLGKRLLERGARRVALTAEGDALLGHARQMLELNDRLIASLDEPLLAGTVRLGTPEDFATTHLPQVLARFAKAYPAVQLEVTCDLTLNLMGRFRDGDFDLVLVKREPERSDRGVRVWREPLVWVAAEHLAVPADGSLPLVVSPPPCVYRKRATDSLSRARRPWRVAYSCASLAGQHAAVKAGLGVTVLPKDMVPAGLSAIERRSGLPDLHDTEIALLAARRLSAPARRLHDHMVRSLENVGEV